MAQFNKLSNREWEVVKLLLQGKSNKLIALSLGISERTVEFHLRNIYAKFQVSSRIELILRLGNATGGLETEKPGYSTVDHRGKNAENRVRLNSRISWAASIRDAIFIIGKDLEMKKLLNFNNLLVLTASLLLLFVNWLAFHDIREAHTVRDWLMLIASVLILLKFARELWNQYFGQVQR